MFLSEIVFLKPSYLCTKFAPFLVVTKSHYNYFFMPDSRNPFFCVEMFTIQIVSLSLTWKAAWLSFPV